MTEHVSSEKLLIEQLGDNAGDSDDNENLSDFSDGSVDQYEFQESQLDELILALIARRDEGACGKELLADLRKIGCDISPGTLYPHLHQLHDNGMLEQQEQIRKKNYIIDAPEQSAMRIKHTIKKSSLLLNLLEESLTELNSDT